VEVVRREELSVWATTRGEEGGNASQLQADNRITLQAVPDGTLLRYESEVAVTGRLGRFALGMMKKKAQALGDEFAHNLQARLAALEAPATAPAMLASGAPAAPVRTAPLPWWRVFWNWLTGRRLPAARNGS
jgi:hypothetical protein